MKPIIGIYRRNETTLLYLIQNEGGICIRVSDYKSYPSKSMTTGNHFLEEKK